MNVPPATPQRPGPGAYINTPARPPPFQMAPPQQPQQAIAPAPVPTQIQRAADAINRMLQVDSRYPSLEAYTRQGSSGEYELPTSQAWAPFQRLRSYEHPETMYDQVNEMQMRVCMGLFAEINHAYLAVDNQLYLWDYTAQRPELIGFEELRDNITCVKLVKPRAKVFVDTISWLLVIATTADIVLIAVECQTGPEGVYEVNLFRTGMQTSVRGINVTGIASSAKTGRIFFVESDTEDVHELCYQQEERWFSNRCSKKNHVTSSVVIPLPTSLWGRRADVVGVKQVVVDDTRNLLYTLSTNSTVKVYHMRTATTLENVIKRDLRTIKSLMSHYIGFQAPVLEGLQIIGIDPIAASEAEAVSLMITSSTGVRIYMSATSGGWGATRAPTDMAVRHIRFPPVAPEAAPAGGANATTTQIQPYQGGTPLGVDSRVLTPATATFRYAPGTFLCAVERTGLNPHELFISTAHTGQLLGGSEPRFTEAGQHITLQGTVQDAGLTTPPFAATNSGSEYAVQFDAPAAEYAIMTHYGIETVRRRRLVDTFAAIIRYGGSVEGVSEDLRRFARHYGLTETASTALAVACGQGADVGADSRVIPITDPEVIETARKAFIDYGGKPQIAETAATEGLSVDSVRPSQRHDGIALYVARLVRSIWDSPIIKQTVKPTGPVLEPFHKVDKLQSIQRSLLSLQQFLDENKTFIDGLAGPDALGRTHDRREEVELQGENRALTSLLLMINNIVEGIAFSLVLFEERLENIMLLLTEETRQEVHRLTFHSLFATSEGRDLAKEIVKAIVNHNIAKGSNVETVAEALRRKCGSFCSSDDVVIFKASENLQKAAQLGANAERGRIQLNDSLRLYEQVAKSLTMEHLTHAVDSYIQLEFYAGAIRLALKVAEERDRGNRALSWIKDGQPADDSRQAPFIQRTNCYRLIFRVIEAVDRAYAAQGNAQTDGVVSQISRRKQEAYEQINNSDDEVFQNFLYDWYMEQGWSERLLEIDSPYVVEYLKRSSETNQAHADLLWRYYAHYSDYLGAAEVQFQLAKSEVFPLSLEQRIEYLSRAKANASTRLTGFTETGARSRQTRQELLRNISDHLDIANIQDDILAKLRADPRFQSLGEARKQDMLNELDGTVKTVDELFNRYTDQAGYYALSLLLFHQADIRDMAHIRTTWTNFIEQTHASAVDSGRVSPWELVALETESLGRRIGSNQNIFPVTDIFQLLLHYDVDKFRTIGEDGNITGERLPEAENPIEWVIDIFFRLGAPIENLVSVVEAMWYAREVPFNSRHGRKLLAKWLVVIVEKWHVATRREEEPFGGTENALGLADVLRVVAESGDFGAVGATGEDREWGDRLRVVRGKVEEVLR